MIEIEVKGFDQIMSKLGRTGGEIHRLAAIIAELVRGQARDRIAVTKTAPDGSAWAPWARNYPKSGSLLVRSGALGSSISGQAVGLEAHVVAPVFYASLHQDGTTKMPARPFLGLSAADEQQIVESIEAFLEDVLK